MKNLGVKLGRKPSDFVAGTLPYAELNPTGNWDAYLPPGEWQKGKEDSMACVTFSLLNCIETQEYFLTGKQINYSDRWIALMSETTPDGNWLYKVADTVRKYGLVKEESWPTPANFTWETYYAKPDPVKQAELEAEGQEWLKTHQFNYEWLSNFPEVIEKHLKQCPLQVVKPGHAIEDYKQVGEIEYIFDTYIPFKKTLQRSDLLDVLKPVLTMKGEHMKLVNDNGTYFLEGEKGKIGIADMPFLNALKGITDKEEIRPSVGVQVRVVETASAPLNTFVIKDK